MFSHRNKAIGILILVAMIFPDHATGATLRMSLVKRALTNYINYDICWADGGPHGGMPYHFGKIVDLSLATINDGRKIYIWGDSLRSSIALHHPQFSVLYYGDYSGDRTAIREESYAYYVQGKQNWVTREGEKFPSGSVIRFQYTIPSHCTMSFPPSQEKTVMVETIVKTFTGFAKQVNHEEQFQYPSPLHIVIANFDVGYPRTLVYVEETHEVYGVTLHDITNYFGDTFPKEGSYPFNLINYFGKDSPLAKKIMKYGIYKTINLSNRNKTEANLPAFGAGM